MLPTPFKWHDKDMVSGERILTEDISGYNSFYFLSNEQFLSFFAWKFNNKICL